MAGRCPSVSLNWLVAAVYDSQFFVDILRFPGQVKSRNADLGMARDQLNTHTRGLGTVISSYLPYKFEFLKCRI
jgi:hypothetical protein